MTTISTNNLKELIPTTTTISIDTTAIDTTTNVLTNSSNLVNTSNVPIISTPNGIKNEIVVAVNVVNSTNGTNLLNSEQILIKPEIKTEIVKEEKIDCDLVTSIAVNSVLTSQGGAAVVKEEIKDDLEPW